MTKPIEGWVATGESGEVVTALLNEDYATGRVINGQAPQHYVEVVLDLPESALGLTFRKVRVTFTDTLEDEVKKAALRYCLDTHGGHCGDECTSFGRIDKIIEDAFCAGAFWREAVDIMSEHFISEAIEKERERIWEEFKSLWPYELNDRARKMIFGDEK